MPRHHYRHYGWSDIIIIICLKIFIILHLTIKSYTHLTNRSSAWSPFSPLQHKAFRKIEVNASWTLNLASVSFNLTINVVETHRCVKVEISPSWPHPHTFEMCPKCRELLLTNEFQLHVLIIVVQKVWADVILWWLAFSKYHFTCARKTIYMRKKYRITWDLFD